MLIVLGKTYSKETRTLRRRLTNDAVKYRYVDLELIAAEDAHYHDWLRSHKIMGLPVLIDGLRFSVGSEGPAVDQLIRSHQQSTNCGESDDD